jgi:hypothetical protein
MNVNQSKKKHQWKNYQKTVSIMNVYVAKMNGLRKYKKLLTNDIKNNNVKTKTTKT